MCAALFCYDFCIKVYVIITTTGVTIVTISFYWGVNLSERDVTDLEFAKLPG